MPPTHEKVITTQQSDNSKYTKDMKEGSQLFRTQKMAGLNTLSKKATQPYPNDGMSASGLEMDLDREEKDSKSGLEVEVLAIELQSESQPDQVSLASENKAVGSFLQKFETKASRQVSRQVGLQHPSKAQFYEHSEFAGRSNLDSILDSGKFCNDEQSPFYAKEE